MQHASVWTGECFKIQLKSWYYNCHSIIINSVNVSSALKQQTVPEILYWKLSACFLVTITDGSVNFCYSLWIFVGWFCFSIMKWYLYKQTNKQTHEYQRVAHLDRFAKKNKHRDTHTFIMAIWVHCICLLKHTR